MTAQPSFPDLLEDHGFPEEDLREGGHDNPGYFRAWLARYERYAAIKILTREATSTLGAGQSDEVAMLEKISSADRSHPGARHLLEYYDTFEIEGPQGPHHCIVTEVLGPSLHSLRVQSEHCLPLRIFKSSMRQVLLGLDYLHTSCGIIHTDIKFDNVMFRLRNMPSVIAQEIAEHPSRTHKTYQDAQPSAHMVESQPMPLALASFDPHKADAVIADFGYSHWVHHHFREDVQPLALRAPEVVLGHSWNQSVDIWGVGCLGIELLTSCTAFQPNFLETYRPIDEDHLAQMTDVTGEQFSLDMLDRSQHRNKFYNQDGTFIHSAAPREPNWPLRRFFAECPSFGPDEREIDAAVNFFKRCLQLRPDKRATARALAEDPWLQTE
ncbi:hypothetical protein FRC10_010847 [Ceratobasidium sp. 414]|nr:hypothetical protein FRC10_010847 [Ceratobasidium sp. 414]